MHSIYINMVCHLHVIDPSVKPNSQRKPKVGEVNRTTINEEVQTLTNVSFITETKYLSWMDNMLLVRNSSRKWCMCIYFIAINVACMEDLFHLLNIDRMIDGSIGDETLNYMEVYSSYI